MTLYYPERHYGLNGEPNMRYTAQGLAEMLEQARQLLDQVQTKLKDPELVDLLDDASTLLSDAEGALSNTPFEVAPEDEEPHPPQNYHVVEDGALDRRPVKVA